MRKAPAAEVLAVGPLRNDGRRERGAASKELTSIHASGVLPDMRTANWAHAFLFLGLLHCGSDPAADGGAAQAGSSSGGAGQGGSAGTNAAGQPGSSGSAGSVVGTCDPSCKGSKLCNDSGQCVCAPGFELAGDNCVASAISDPKGRTKAEVCQRYKEAMAGKAAQPVAGSGGDCDPGTVPFEGQVAALRYLNFYRWMIGVGPVEVDPSVAVAEQQCAKILNYAFGHDPPPTTQCYTAEGAAACGSSLIASGFGLVGQVDGYALETNQNLIHRRNVLSVGRAGIWFGASGGGAAMHYGGAYTALPTDPAYVVHPGPGLNVRNMVPSKWFVQKGVSDTPPLAARVTVVGTGESKPMKLEHHFGNFSSFDPDGWMPENDVAYKVELVDDNQAVFGQFETTFITCQ